jgi:hypothetical protein
MTELATNDKIEEVEKAMLELPQLECPLQHHFCNGVYLRVITMPKGAKIIGHEHKTEHFNVILSGKAKVICGDDVSIIEAPHLFVSKPGVRKILEIIEDMSWMTVHPTDKKEFSDGLESDLINKSASFKSKLEVCK